MTANVNISTMNKAELAKAAMNEHKSGGAATDNKPSYMKNTGSIFNAQTTQRPGKGFNWNDQKYGETKAKGSANNQSQEVSDAKAGSAMSQAKAAQGGLGGLKSSASSTQTDADDEKTVGVNAQSLGKTIDKNDKQYQANYKKDIAAQNKTNQEIVKNTAKMKEETANITDLTSQMEALQSSGDGTGVGSSSAYSLQLPGGGDQNSGANGANGTTNAFSTGGSPIGGNNDNAQQLEGLSSQLDSSLAKMEGYSKANVKLQQVAQRQVKQMNMTNQSYIKQNNANQTAMDNEHKVADKVIDVAGKVDTVGQITSTTGMAVSIIGQILEKCPTPYTAAIGGTVHGIGETVKAVGSYASCAANVTKTVAYATEGDIKNALMSAGSAIMSGASAAASTGAATKAFENAGKMYQAAGDVGKTAAEKAAAVKDIVKGAAEGAKQGGSQVLQQTMQLGGAVQQISQFVPGQQQQPMTNGYGGSYGTYNMSAQSMAIINRDRKHYA